MVARQIENELRAVLAPRVSRRTLAHRDAHLYPVSAASPARVYRFISSERDGGVERPNAEVSARDRDPRTTVEYGKRVGPGLAFHLRCSSAPTHLHLRNVHAQKVKRKLRYDTVSIDDYSNKHAATRRPPAYCSPQTRRARGIDGGRGRPHGLHRLKCMHIRLGRAFGRKMPSVILACGVGCVGWPHATDAQCITRLRGISLARSPVLLCSALALSLYHISSHTTTIHSFAPLTTLLPSPHPHRSGRGARPP